MSTKDVCFHNSVHNGTAHNSFCCCYTDVCNGVALGVQVNGPDSGTSAGRIPPEFEYFFKKTT